MFAFSYEDPFTHKYNKILELPTKYMYKPPGNEKNKQINQKQNVKEDKKKNGNELKKSNKNVRKAHTTKKKKLHKKKSVKQQKDSKELIFEKFETFCKEKNIELDKYIIAKPNEEEAKDTKINTETQN